MTSFDIQFKMKTIDTQTGAFCLSGSFRVTANTTMAEIAGYFDNLKIGPVRKSSRYSKATVYNCKCTDCYITATFYFENDRLSHINFYPKESPEQSNWDNYDRDAEMQYMTKWMAKQANDKNEYVWNLAIAGRQYHFTYDWGSMGVYYDFKSGSFSCTVRYIP